jgi:hypothetical protein
VLAGPRLPALAPLVVGLLDVELHVAGALPDFGLELTKLNVAPGLFLPSPSSPRCCPAPPLWTSTWMEPASASSAAFLKLYARGRPPSRQAPRRSDAEPSAPLSRSLAVCAHCTIRCLVLLDVHVLVLPGPAFFLVGFAIFANLPPVRRFVGRYRRPSGWPRFSPPSVVAIRSVTRGLRFSDQRVLRALPLNVAAQPLRPGANPCCSSPWPCRNLQGANFGDRRPSRGNGLRRLRRDSDRLIVGVTDSPWSLFSTTRSMGPCRPCPGAPRASSAPSSPVRP